MGSHTPTLINLPPHPSDPVTPSDKGPGTPNSTTTSMSELSTVAIKDGHRGHLPHHYLPLEAERADRISRLAGLERVTASRPAGTGTHGSFTAGSGGGTGTSVGAGFSPSAGYFDANNNPQLLRERSTVGSASATGSVGGRTTWASGSDLYDPDKMSETQDGDVDVDVDADADPDVDVDALGSVPGDGDGDGDVGYPEAETASSVGGFSDEANSLVGFGEGARTPARQHSAAGITHGSPVTAKGAGLVGRIYGRDGPSASPTPGRLDARMIDGMAYDSDVVDITTDRTPPLTVDAQRPLGPEAASLLHQKLRRKAAATEPDPSVGS